MIIRCVHLLQTVLVLVAVRLWFRVGRGRRGGGACGRLLLSVLPSVTKTGRAGTGGGPGPGEAGGKRREGKIFNSAALVFFFDVERCRPKLCVCRSLSTRARPDVLLNGGHASSSFSPLPPLSPPAMPPSGRKPVLEDPLPPQI